MVIDRIHDRYSAATGMRLPLPWLEATQNERHRIVAGLARLREFQGFMNAPPFWHKMVAQERYAIRKHLQMIGALSATSLYPSDAEVAKGVIARRKYGEYHGGMLYSKPNGGHRILPSVYCRIHGPFWLRANKIEVAITDMNDGHLKNTLALLMESHGNLLGKATELLGKISHHFVHFPDILQALETACLLIQQADIEDVYPIFTPLADEQAVRDTREKDYKTWLDASFDDDLEHDV